MRRRGVLGIVMFLALGLFLVPGAAFATTNGQGGILTSQGADISVQILANNAGFTENLFVLDAANVAHNISAASNTGATFCIYAANGVSCGANSLANGKNAIIAGNVPVAGTEVVFGVQIPGNQTVGTTTYTYNTYNVFTGPAARNADDLTHNNNSVDGPQPGGGNLENVGFEDLEGQAPTPFGTPCTDGHGNPFSNGNLPCSDRDFNDTVYLFSGVNPFIPSTTSEPSSLLLLGSGLAGLSGIAWRRRGSK